MKRLDAAKLERLGRLVCGPLWQSELARTSAGRRSSDGRRGSSTRRLNILPRPKSGSGSCSAYSKCCEGERRRRSPWLAAATTSMSPAFPSWASVPAFYGCCRRGQEKARTGKRGANPGGP